MSDVTARLRLMMTPDGMQSPLGVEAAAEIVRLRRWKTDATYVLDAWEEAWESAGISGSLGATKSEAMLDEITLLRAEVERLTTDMSTMHRTVVHDCCVNVQAERVLADQLAEALRLVANTWGVREHVRRSEHAPVADALATYDAARKEAP